MVMAFAAFLLLPASSGAFHYHVRTPISPATPSRRIPIPFERAVPFTLNDASRARAIRTAARITALRAATKPPPLPDTSDPFVLLGLDPSNPTVDKREIKRAYKRMALRYHPDVVVNSESTDEEKRRANDDFAKVNAAYEVLSGKGGGGVGVGAGPNGAGSKTGAGTGGGWTPPHRRKGPQGYSSSSGTGAGGSPGASTDWRDYMPDYAKEEDSKYNPNGDSFGDIFSDLLESMAGAAVAGGAAGGLGGAAAGVAGAAGGGILRDLIEFLEGNVDGFSSGYDDDDGLSELLKYGSLEEVAAEMDDTDLLVQQLETKLDGAEKDLINVKADIKESMRFVDKVALEERLAELEARKEVVSGYIKQSRKRLVKLQARYKELIVEGRRDGRAGTGGYYSGAAGRGSGEYDVNTGDGGSGTDAKVGYGSARASSGGGYGGSARSTQPPSPSPSYSSPSPRASAPSYSSSSSTASGTAPTPSSSESASTPGGEGDSSSWNKSEGFGSFGRRGGRGTGRRRGRRAAEASAGAASEPSAPSASPAEDGGGSYTGQASAPRGQQQQQQARQKQQRPRAPSPSPPPRRPQTTTTSTSTSVTKRTQSDSGWVPPHRRTSPDRQVRDDKKRIRELQVEDEFENLKKEMGL